MPKHLGCLVGDVVSPGVHNTVLGEDRGTTMNPAHFPLDCHFPPLPTSPDSCPESGQLVEGCISQLPTFIK